MALMVSVSESIFKPLIEVEFEKVVQRIKSGTLADEISDIRMASPEQAKELKRNLPLFSGGLFKAGRRVEQEWQGSDVMIYDWDHLSDETLPLLKTALIKDKRTLACFVSPSGSGIKAVFRLDTTLRNVQYYKSVYKQYSDLFAKAFPSGDTLDRKTSDVTRVCFLSDDPECYYNPNCAALDTSVVYAPDFSVASKTNFVEVRIDRDDQLIRDACSFLAGRISNYTDWVRCGLALCNHPDGENLFVQVSSNPAYNDSEADIRRKFKSLMKGKKGSIAIGTVVYLAKELGYKPESSGDDITSLPGEKSVKRSSFEECAEFIAERYQFRYNTLDEFLYMKRTGEQQWNRVTDYMLNSLHIQFARANGKIGFDAFLRLLLSEFTPLHDPIQEYFDGLPAWDGEDHILAMTESLIADDQTQWRQAFRKWIVGAVACAISPEINRLCLVLQGEQNHGKTRWLNGLCPDPLKEYTFVGNVNDDKDSRLEIVKKFLVNLDELDSMNRDDISYLKSIISTKHFDMRKPYGRMTEKFTRRSSFCGSVNKADFLNDVTGNTRFLCFEAKEIYLDYQQTVNLDQVWAQAKHLFNNRERYWLNVEEGKLLSQRNEKFMAVSMEKELLMSKYQPADKYKDTEGYDGAAWKTTTEIALDIFGERNFNNGNVQRLGGILRKEGFTRSIKRTGGELLYKWYVKNADRPHSW